MDGECEKERTDRSVPNNMNCWVEIFICICTQYCKCSSVCCSYNVYNEQNDVYIILRNEAHFSLAFSHTDRQRDTQAHTHTLRNVRSLWPKHKSQSGFIGYIFKRRIDYLSLGNNFFFLSVAPSIASLPFILAASWKLRWMMIPFAQLRNSKALLFLEFNSRCFATNSIRWAGARNMIEDSLFGFGQRLPSHQIPKWMHQ